MVAARQWMLVGDTKGSGRREKVQSVPFSQSDLARRFRASKSTIAQARDLLAEAPDLAALVETCAKGLAEATKELDWRRNQAQKQTQDAEKASRFSAEYRELISDGKTTAEEAMEEIFRREREERERLRIETEGRQIWFEGLETTLTWIEESVATRDDDYLDFYTREDLPSIDHKVTAKRIEECKAQLDRISSITLGGTLNGRGNSGRAQGRSKNRQTAS